MNHEINKNLFFLAKNLQNLWFSLNFKIYKILIYSEILLNIQARIEFKNTHFSIRGFNFCLQLSGIKFM